MESRRFEIEVPAPFGIDLTTRALRRRAHNADDEGDGGLWRRAVATDDGAVRLTVAQTGTAGWAMTR